MHPTWVPGFPRQKCLASLGGHFWRLVQPTIGEVLGVDRSVSSFKGDDLSAFGRFLIGGCRVGGSPWRSGAKRRSRVASRRGRSPQEAETILRFILDPAVRRDSVRYRKVKELSRIKDLLSLCFLWKKFRRRFPLPRGLVPETTRDGFLKPRHQRFLIPRASPAPGWAVASS